MKSIVDDVATYGWQVVGVSPEGVAKGPEFSFSVGLFETYKHPELLVFGLPPDDADGLLTKCVERITQGANFSHGQFRADILNRHRVAVLAIEPSFYPDYLGAAIGFYGHTDFPALQIVWPDQNDGFPWERGYDLAYRSSQVILHAT